MAAIHKQKKTYFFGNSSIGESKFHIFILIFKNIILTLNRGAIQIDGAVRLEVVYDFSGEQ